MKARKVIEGDVIFRPWGADVVLGTYHEYDYTVVSIENAKFNIRDDEELEWLVWRPGMGIQ
jgi:hypothetical protein